MFKMSYLVAKNSFISGMGRVLDLGATRRRTLDDKLLKLISNDSQAIKRDWNVTGNDVRRAMNELEAEERYDGCRAF